MRIVVLCIGMLITVLMSGCISYDMSRKVVQQGNLLPQSKIEKLRPGMSKEQVAILMGTSLMGPLFDNDRWDYAYTLRKGGSPLLVKNVVVYFSQGVVTRIEHRP